MALDLYLTELRLHLHDNDDGEMSVVWWMVAHKGDETPPLARLCGIPQLIRVDHLPLDYMCTPWLLLLA